MQPKPVIPRRPSVTWCRVLLAVASLLATSAVPMATMAHGLATAPDAAPGPLRIEVEPTIDDASTLSAWILEREQDVAKTIPLAEGHEQWIAVKVGGATYDYRVSVVVMRDGLPLGPVGEPETCECNSEALLAMVDDRIAAKVEELRVHPPTEASAPEPPAPAPKVPVTDDSHRRSGAMGSVGIGMAVLGAGLLGVGVPLALRQDEIRGEPGHRIEKRSIHDLGIGMAAVGGVALLAGVSLHVVDLVRRRQRAVAVVPTLGPRHAGLTIAWKLQRRLTR